MVSIVWQVLRQLKRLPDFTNQSETIRHSPSIRHESIRRWLRQQWHYRTEWTDSPLVHTLHLSSRGTGQFVFYFSGSHLNFFFFSYSFLSVNFFFGLRCRFTLSCWKYHLFLSLAAEGVFLSLRCLLTRGNRSEVRGPSFQRKIPLLKDRNPSPESQHFKRKVLLTPLFYVSRPVFQKVWKSSSSLR